MNIAHTVGAGFILQMDSNAHLGKDIVKNDVNDQNLNGKLFAQFLERMPNLTLINSLDLCEGTITRIRKTIRGFEFSVLDVFVTCDRILPFIKWMTVDEKRETVLTNYSLVKKVGRVIESDHNPVKIEVNLSFTKAKPERIDIFQFKNRFSQQEFKRLTTDTTEFSDCFKNNISFENQAMNWRKVLTKFFQQSFKKIRITNNPVKNKSSIVLLMDKRMYLKKKQILSDDEEDELVNLEVKIAEACENENRKKVMDNFQEMEADTGNLNHLGVWKAKRKYFPKVKPSIPVGKKMLKKQLITNPEELKDLYLETFKYRLRHIPVKPGYESLLDKQKELFKLRLEMAKRKKTPDWKMTDLEKALKKLKNGKCRDPEGLIRELFKEEVIGDDLKKIHYLLFSTKLNLLELSLLS